jgi:hypothetical protein
MFFLLRSSGFEVITLQMFSFKIGTDLSLVRRAFGVGWRGKAEQSVKAVVKVSRAVKAAWVHC